MLWQQLPECLIIVNLIFKLCQLLCFLEYHKQKDNYEYLEIKEDIVKERLERAQEIIKEYFRKERLTEAKQVIKNPVYLEEIIQNLLMESKLTHRQIANLLEISNNIVHKVSLHID